MADIKNFKGKIHELSNADRVKGGEVSSPKKILANRVKNLKHGKYSELYHPLLTCVDCPFIFTCEKRTQGYCVYLVEHLNRDELFRKQILGISMNKENLNLTRFISAKYSLKNGFIEIIKHKLKENK